MWSCIRVAVAGGAGCAGGAGDAAYVRGARSDLTSYDRALAPVTRTPDRLTSGAHARGDGASKILDGQTCMMLRPIVLASIILALAPSASPGSAVAQDLDRPRLGAVAQALADASPSVRRLDPRQREEVTAFVVGNALFVLAHELGHAAVSEFDLPVLGREEDAVDMFATLALLHIGSDFSHSVLVDAARGHYLIGERNLQQGHGPTFYGAHSLDQQRAYQIICLMVGSDPGLFWGVAVKAGLPAERKETCRGDFERAETSWIRLLQPHFRPVAAKPSFLEHLLHLAPGSSSSIMVRYADARGRAAQYRQALETAGILDIVREFAQASLNFPKDIVIEGRACGYPNAYWDPGERRIIFCYELVPDFVELAVHDLR